MIIELTARFVRTNGASLVERLDPIRGRVLDDCGVSNPTMSHVEARSLLLGLSGNASCEAEAAYDGAKHRAAGKVHWTEIPQIDGRGGRVGKQSSTFRSILRAKFSGIRMARALSISPMLRPALPGGDTRIWDRDGLSNLGRRLIAAMGCPPLHRWQLDANPANQSGLDFGLV